MVFMRAIGRFAGEAASGVLAAGFVGFFVMLAYMAVFLDLVRLRPCLRRFPVGGAVQYGDVAIYAPGYRVLNEYEVT